MPDEPGSVFQGEYKLLTTILDRIVLTGWATSYAITSTGYSVRWTKEGKDNLFILRGFADDLGIRPTEFAVLGIVLGMAFQEFPERG